MTTNTLSQVPRELAERLLPTPVNSLNCPSVEQVEAVIREAMQKAQPQWISVEDKLPELTPYLPYANCHSSEPVLIWLTDQSCIEAYFCEKNDGERWWEVHCPASWTDRNDEHCIKLDKVTHWQPLLEPPNPKAASSLTEQETKP
jgi:hypothetical protein